MKISTEDLIVVHDLQRRQTDNAVRLGCAIREIVHIALISERGLDGDAKVGAHTLTLWPQIEKAHATYRDLDDEQVRAGKAALCRVGVDPDQKGEMYRIADDGTVLRLQAGEWLEA